MNFYVAKQNVALSKILSDCFGTIPKQNIYLLYMALIISLFLNLMVVYISL